MLNLKPLNKDVEKIKKYLLQNKNRLCDVSVGFTYMWANEVNINYDIVNDTLIELENSVWCKDTFYYPLGKDVAGALDEIERYTVSKGIPLKFCTIDIDQVNELKNRYFIVEEEYLRDWSDYIYLAEDLKYFKGKKFSGQRNHLNKFNKLYPDYKFTKMVRGDEPRIKEFLKEYETTKPLNHYLAEDEFNKSMEFIDKALDLNQLGGIVTVNGKIVAVSIGEVVGDTLIIHIEKALRSFEGSYQAIVSEFAKAYAVDGVKYINREEDCGDEGLRTSKMQYHPIEIRNKYAADVKTAFCKIPKNLTINTERLILTEIKEEDKEAYFKLYTDDERNKFWGYDYREDLGDKKPTPEYFFNFQNELKKAEEEFSLAIRLDGKMIGEAVMHNFDYYGNVETGIRIFPEYEGKGYAKEALLALDDFIKNVLNAKRIHAKCYKENSASDRLHLAAGYKKVSEDDKYFYFEK